MTEITRLREVVQILRTQVHKEMPSQHIALLLTVAENPGLTMPELMIRLKMPQGSLSRNIKILSSYVVRENGLLRSKGRGLLHAEPSGGNGKSLVVRLTSKGEAVVGQLAAAIRMDHSGEPLHRKVVGT